MQWAPLSHGLDTAWEGEAPWSPSAPVQVVRELWLAVMGSAAKEPGISCLLKGVPKLGMLQTNYPIRQTKETLTISQACTRTTHAFCKRPVEIVIKDTIRSFGGFPESFITGFCQAFSSLPVVWCDSKAGRPLPCDSSLELFSTAPANLVKSAVPVGFMGSLAFPPSLLWPCWLCVAWMSSHESCTVNSRTAAGWRIRVWHVP